MAYVRKVRTGSGAVAVQVVTKAGGRLRVLEHVGSAHTDAELGVLLERAGEVLRGGQGVLDVQVPARVARVDKVADWTGRAQPSGTARHGEVAAAGRTRGTASRLLYEAIGGVYDQLGFDEVDDPVFRDLVIARIVEPTSKLDAGRVLADLGAQAVSYSTIQRHLRAVIDQDYRDSIASACFTHAQASGDISLILYDVTTLYFEAENEDDLRKVGFSKERRVDPQVVVGLLVDRAGFPLEIGCFEGNKAETKTLLPIIRQFRDRHKLEDMVVVADAGMLSGKNLAELDQEHLKFIVGSRATKAPGDLEHHFRWHGDAFTDGQVIDTITPRHASSKVHDDSHRTEPVWDPASNPQAWRAIWSYSRKRAVRDGHTLTAQENRARAIIAGEKPVKSTRFVRSTPTGRSLDEASLARARKLVGLKGYVCNIPAHLMGAREVISSYHDLWNVEASFRLSKTDLRARPMFHRTQDAIEAHLTLVFAALATSREMQRRTGKSIQYLIKQLRPLRTSTIVINGTSTDFPPEISQEHQTILAQLRASPGH